MIEVEPQPRIDTVVRLPGGGEARGTEYTGTAWFDGKPQVSGLLLRRPPNAPRGIRTPNFQASFFIPIVDAGATFTEDPSGIPTWIQMHVNGHLGWPAGVGYRVVALTHPTPCGEG
jgi:hypothetical protein